MSSTLDEYDVPFVPAAVAGVAAYVLGYLVTYVWQSGSVHEMLGGYNAIIQFFGGDALPAWKAVGWLFYNAHFVAFTTPSFGGKSMQNLIASGDAPSLLYAVPVLCLLAAGFAVAWYTDARDTARGAKAGAAVTVGYVVLALVGVFLFRVTRSDTTIGTDPVTGILLAGLVYPLVLATAGGAIAAAVNGE